MCPISTTVETLLRALGCVRTASKASVNMDTCIVVPHGRVNHGQQREWRLRAGRDGTEEYWKGMIERCRASRVYFRAEMTRAASASLRRPRDCDDLRDEDAIDN